MFSRHRIGDRNGVFSYSDYLEAWEYLDSRGEEPARIYGTRMARSDMKSDDKFIQKHDLLLEDAELDALTRYGIYLDLVEDGLGLYDGVPVYRYDGDDITQDTCVAYVVGDGGTRLKVRG